MRRSDTRSRLLKLAALTVGACAFVASFCYLWVDDAAIQAIGLALALPLSIWRRSLWTVLAELRAFLAFASVMGLCYLGFGLLELNGQPLIHWAWFGATRIMLFLTTVLAVGFLLSFLTLEDILALPLSMDRLKIPILAETLFRTARRAMAPTAFFVDLFPEFQARTGSRNFRSDFRKRLLSVLALVFLILRESEIQGEMIDNRIRHCFPGKQQKENVSHDSRDEKGRPRVLP